MDYKTDRWLRISNNLKLEILDNPDPDLSDTTRFWLKRIYVKSNSASNILYHTYEYEIYDSFLNKAEITEQNLVCTSIYEEYIYPGGSRTYFVLNTPDEESMRVPVDMSEFYGKEKSIIIGYKFMLKHGHLHTWEAINFSVENLKLKDKINSLEEENNEQKKLIEDLDCQLKNFENN